MSVVDGNMKMVGAALYTRRKMDKSNSVDTPSRVTKSICVKILVVLHKDTAVKADSLSKVSKKVKLCTIKN